MKAPGALIALFAIAFAGCAADTLREGAFCASDAECAADQVCFVDGCGDPGTGIVAEVIAGAASGQLAQDFQIPELHPVQNLEAFEPAVIIGVMEQDAPPPIETVAYSKKVLFRAYGTSVLIPGRARSMQYSVVPEQGGYEVAMPTGAFSITVTPQDSADSLVPPQHVAHQIIQPGQAVNLDFTFPAISGTTSPVRRLHGRLLKTASPEVRITEAAMQVQAFRPDGMPLSQRAQVSSGQMDSTGGFIIGLPPTDERLTRIIIRATPEGAPPAMPSRSFTIDLTDAVVNTETDLTIAPLEMGDFGQATQITGRVLDTGGEPVAGAYVHIVGTVRGGAEFRSAPVSTGLDGRFTLAALPSVPDGSLELVVAPTAKSFAGLLSEGIEIAQEGADLGDLVAPDRVQITGRIVDPTGAAAPGVSVAAEPIDTVPGTPLPVGVTRATSDADGRYTLRLDPAQYRLDFIPSDLRPRVSRPWTVDAATAPGSVIELPEFRLSNGRRVTGTISSIPRRLATPTPSPARYATVRFFRVTHFDSGPSSVLLAEGVADANGQYSVILPTRDE